MSTTTEAKREEVIHATKREDGTTALEMSWELATELLYKLTENPPDPEADKRMRSVYVQLVKTVVPRLPYSVDVPVTWLAEWVIVMGDEKYGHAW